MAVRVPVVERTGLEAEGLNGGRGWAWGGRCQRSLVVVRPVLPRQDAQLVRFRLQILGVIDGIAVDGDVVPDELGLEGGPGCLPGKGSGSFRDSAPIR